MTTTAPIPTSTRTRTSTPASERQPLWKHGAAAAVTASATTSALAAVASKAGVSFAGADGKSIPVAGFAELTLIFSLIGVAVAAVMARRARHPRSTFVRTAVALTALSVVPDLTFGFDAASAVTLMSLHLVAAVIVVPTLARRLAHGRA